MFPRFGGGTNRTDTPGVLGGRGASALRRIEWPDGARELSVDMRTACDGNGSIAEIRRTHRVGPCLAGIYSMLPGKSRRGRPVQTIPDSWQARSFAIRRSQSLAP